ncbi:hypothetical protein [Rossellomorea marisflavi]|uniref:hypothetical protein n=1 Tax=Rossellomorea marisflavi TaxID=189381 RepID=UPI003FA174F7
MTRKLIVKIKGENVDLYQNGWMHESVLVAIASRESTWKEINEEYEKTQEQAILAYKKSHLYNSPLLNTLTTPIKILSIKIFSLYALHEEQGTGEEFIERKIKNHFTRYVNYISGSTTFHWNSLINYIEERESGLTENDKHHIFMIVIYLLGEDPLPHMSNMFGKSILGNIIQNSSVTAKSDEKFERLKVEQKDRALTYLQDALGFKVRKTMKVDTLFGLHEEQILKNKLSNAERRAIANDNNYEKVYVHGLYRYFKPLTAIMRNMNLNDFNFMATVDISPDELTGIYAMFHAGVNLGRLKEEEWEHYLTASILIIMLVKHYQQLSEFYMESMQRKEDEVLKDQSEKEDAISWEKDKESLLQEKGELERKVQAQSDYIQELERKMKLMEQERKEEQSLKKEVVSLRNYAHQHQEEIPAADDNPIDEVKLLKDWADEHQAVVFGGHPNLVNKLKGELPSIEYRDVDTLNRDLDFLQNKEIVFLVTNYFNHPFYYKLMNELQGLPNTKLVYLSGYPNTERTMREMWSGLSTIQ